MRLEAIYDNGKLEFQDKVHFVHNKFPVAVTVADAEIVTSQEMAIDAPSTSSAHALLARVRDILGPLDRERPQTTVSQDKESYQDALEEKYLK